LQYTTFTSFTIGAPCVVTPGAKTANNTANTVSQPFQYVNLPSSNSEFGNKTVTFAVSAPDLSTTQSAAVQIFFIKAGTNHPGPELPIGGVTHDTQTPNWYFYWSQTSANYAAANHVWGGTDAAGRTGRTIWDTVQHKWVCLIYDAAGYATMIGTWNNAEGIDLFANVCRHEEQHRLDNTATLWPTGYNPNGNNDGDGDYLPDDQEAALGKAIHPTSLPAGYDPTKPLTPGVMDTYRYGDGLNDDEDYTLCRQPVWTAGSADLLDWSNPGHQY
jgi:hypothetical protein